jgi:hypothetical protein
VTRRSSEGDQAQSRIGSGPPWRDKVDLRETYVDLGAFLTIDGPGVDGVLVVVADRADVFAVLVEGDGFDGSRVSVLIELGDSLAVGSFPDADDGNFAELAGHDEGSVVVDGEGSDIIVVADGGLGVTSAEELLGVVGFVQDDTEGGSHVNDVVGV